LWIVCGPLKTKWDALETLFELVDKLRARDGGFPFPSWEAWSKDISASPAHQLVRVRQEFCNKDKVMPIKSLLEAFFSWKFSRVLDPVLALSNLCRDDIQTALNDISTEFDKILARSCEERDDMAKQNDAEALLQLKEECCNILFKHVRSTQQLATQEVERFRKLLRGILRLPNDDYKPSAPPAFTLRSRARAEPARVLPNNTRSSIAPAWTSFPVRGNPLPTTQQARLIPPASTAFPCIYQRTRHWGASLQR
jgi:hypothetical protein